MTAAQILRAAAEIVERPGAWTQGAWARDEDGDYALPTTVGAVCWCAVGAIRRTPGESEGEALLALAEAIKDTVPECYFAGDVDDLVEWNDAEGRTATEVATAMRHAADTLDPPHRSDACASGGEHPVNCFENCCLGTAKEEESDNG